MFDRLIQGLLTLIVSTAEAPPLPSFTDADIRLMADVVCWEARGEPFADQRDVAYVIRNRLASGKYGRTVSDVIYQRNQFSGFFPGQRARECLHHGDAYGRAVLAVLVGVHSDHWNHGATHFAVCRLGPNVFGPKFKLVRRHAGHCFYRQVSGG